MDFNAMKIQQPLMLLQVIKMWMSLNGSELKAKIVFLVNGHPTNAYLKYNGLYDMYPSFKQVKHYENQNS